jgi:catechol 2,3-dioxygenase-like lactoylglutathione lyase family enzyme
MFSHIMVGTNDIERSKRFYDAVLGVLGAGEPVRNQAKTGHVRLFYRHDGQTFCVSEPINGQPASFANGGTIGFKCESPSRCTSSTPRRWRTAAVRSRMRRGLREGSLGAMYLAYVRDPDGNKLCALHRPKV